MAKLTQKDKEDILKEYAAGRSVRDIAKKFTVSPTAISKILNRAKSLPNDKKSLHLQDNSEIARQIVDKAMIGILEEIQKASVRDKLKAIEQLSAIYDLKDFGSEPVDTLRIVIEDGSNSNGTED